MLVGCLRSTWREITHRKHSGCAGAYCLGNWDQNEPDSMNTMIQALFSGTCLKLPAIKVWQSWKVLLRESWNAENIISCVHRAALGDILEDTKLFVRMSLFVENFATLQSLTNSWDSTWEKRKPGKIIRHVQDHIRKINLDTILKPWFPNFKCLSYSYILKIILYRKRKMFHFQNCIL